MSKISLALLICAAALFAPSASAATVDTVVLFNPAAFEAPESIQIDRHGSAYVTLALTGEVRKVAPGGTQTTLAFMPIRPEPPRPSARAATTKISTSPTPPSPSTPSPTRAAPTSSATTSASPASRVREG